MEVTRSGLVVWPQFYPLMVAFFGSVLDAGGWREEFAGQQIRCFSEDQKDLGGVWKSLSHSNPASREVSGLNPRRGPLIHQTAIPGSAMEEQGHFSALGQASHSSGRKRRKRLFERCTARSWRRAGVSAHGCQCLCGRAKEWWVI